MGLILAALGIVAVCIGSVLIAAISNQIVYEFQGWTPRLVEWLIDRAVRRLPDDLQERMAEEWRAFIAETPGHIVKIARAFGLTRGALAISQERAGTANNSWTERAISRGVGLAALALFAPLFLTIGIALKLERPGPLFEAMKSDVRALRYRFRVGTGQTSDILRKAKMVDLPWVWSLVTGDIVLPPDFWRRGFQNLKVNGIAALLQIWQRLKRMFGSHL